jgi:Putative zinc-finger
MCNHELLVSYLYDDVSDRDRAALDLHLRGCAACREELESLRGVRVDLSTWAPPLPELGFRIVRKRPARETWRAWWTPAAGLAAAAVLVLAAAASIAHIEVRRGPDGMSIRTGWSTVPARSEGSLAETGSSAARDVHLSSAPAIDADTAKEILRRVDALEASMRGVSAVRNASTLTARSADAEIIRRVREMLSPSETKQEGELALRLAQVIRDVNAQRNADLARIQQGLGRIDAITTAEAAAHRDLANYVFTAAGKQK